MVQLLKKIIRLKSKEGTILYPELGDKTVTREKLVEGNNIPIILTLTPVEDDFYKVNKNDVEEGAIYYYVEGITGAHNESTPIFLNLTYGEYGDLLVPVTKLSGGDSDNPIATKLMHGFTISFYKTELEDKTLIYTKESDTYFERIFLEGGSINGLEYDPLYFDPHSDYTTVTVPPNRRMYYYDPNAESSGKPKYSMGVHGDIIFNLDLLEDSDTVSYHIELWEYMSGKRIKFPENINFQITPISTYQYNGGSTKDSALQPNVNVNSDYTELTVTGGENSAEAGNYHMIIDIFFNGKCYLGTIRVIPMVESQMPKNSKIKFVFDNDGGSYSDIVPSSGTIGGNGLLYINKAGEFTYTYKGTKYTPGITIDQYNPINEVIRIQN
nr:MAG TPA: hypothetical protein [Crassvirales sp.]